MLEDSIFGGRNLSNVLVAVYLVVFFLNTVQGAYILEQGSNSWEISGYVGSQTGADWHPGTLAGWGEEFVVSMYLDKPRTENLMFNSEADNNRFADIFLNRTSPNAETTKSVKSGDLSLSNSPEGQWTWSSSENVGGVVDLGPEWRKITVDPRADSGVGPNLIYRGPDYIIDLDDNQPFNITSTAPYPPDNPDPADGTELITRDVTLSAEYSNPLGRSGTLTFYNNETGDPVNGDISSSRCGPVGNNTRCSVTWTGLSGGRDYSWHVVAEHSPLQAQSDNWTFHVNGLPSVTDANPRDGGIGSQKPPQSVNVTVSDEDDSTLHVYFFNNTGSEVSIGEGKKSVSSGGNAGVFWHGLKIGQDYSWKVNVSDGHQNVTRKFNFRKVPSNSYRTITDIKYRYTAVTTSVFDPRFVFVEVINEAKEPKELNTSLSGAGLNATFVESGKPWISYTLEEDSSRKFEIKINPQSIYPFKTDFEGVESDWYCMNNVNLSTCTTDSNDKYSSPDESLKTGAGDGVCNIGGVSKDFDFYESPEKLVLDMKVSSEDWGRNSIVVQNSSGNYTIWRKKGSGSSYDDDWRTRKFDISNVGNEFTLIIGNDDRSSTCGNYDHGWTFWADDIRIIGERGLLAATKNKELGTVNSDSIPVLVRNSTAVSARGDVEEVPGIGMVQLLFLLLVSSSLYFALL